uniref:Uncharacterized protein n=1 Tax=Fagus sylvatica TaxID=28930 RepID=A0A2N9HKY1_FAGSY
MADSSFLLSTISLAQMEPTGSKGGTWKAMGVSNFGGWALTIWVFGGGS